MDEHPPAAIVVHGGAGDVDPSRREAARAGVRRAAEAGLALLASGADALDAAQHAVRVLEDDPSFNAGTGSVLARDGSVEVDAALMDGRDLRFGAVAAMADCDRAIDVARAVLDDGEHVLLAGPGAWDFAREHGFTPALRARLVTERSLRRWRAARDARDGGAVDPGTVGACAVDARGHVAAATSTGGTTYKRPGRVGDTPLCGCGTFADDRGGAASATGHGEGIVRITMTRVCVDAMRLGASASEAAWRAVDELARVEGSAGIICVGPGGDVGVALNTKTMSWAAARVGDAAIAELGWQRDRVVW